MKIIDFVRYGMPENPPFSYGDNVAVIADGEQLFIGECSTEPNAFGLDDHTPWYDKYARIAPGSYDGACINHAKYGKCILINAGGKVSTVNPNVNHMGERYATEVFIHKGFSMTCRGSKACLTIRPDKSDDFFSCFAIGDQVKVNLHEKAAV
jgi:hypothetical protein